MSTIDAYALIAATTVGRDIVWRIRGGDPARIPPWSRYGLWLTAAFAAVLALARPSVVALWHDLGSIVTPVLLLPVLLAFGRMPRPGPRGALLLMLVPAVVTLFWVVWKGLPRSKGAYPFAIEPIYAGLAASLLAWGLTRLSGEESVS